MSTLFLEFVELDDFHAELKDRGINQVRIEIESNAGVPSGDFLNASHTVHAIVTAFTSESDRDAVIVRWKTLLLLTDSMSLRVDSKKSQEKMFANFEVLKTNLSKLGLFVKRGQWKVA